MLPPPSQRYDATNEAAFRQIVERTINTLLRQELGAGEEVEGALLVISGGKATWLEPGTEGQTLKIVSGVPAWAT